MHCAVRECRHAAYLLLVCLLCACAGGGSHPQPATPPGGLPPPPGATRPAADQYARYKCGDGQEFSVTFQGGGTRALVNRSGYSDLLRQVPGASGTRYGDGKSVLYVKGDTASLEVGGSMLMRNCHAVAPFKK